MYSYREDGSTRAGEDIEQLELIGIDVIPAPHARHAENELQKKGQDENRFAINEKITGKQL
jgi:hypothetical protein